MEFTFEDLIDLYKSKNVSFSLMPSDTVYCYLMGAGTTKFQSNVPADKRRATDMVSYGYVYSPYRTEKSSVRLIKRDDIVISEVLGSKNEFPNVEGVNKIIEEYPSTICDKDTRVSVYLPPLHYILNDFFDNIFFREDELSFTIRYNNGLSNNLEGLMAIEIPQSMFNRGGKFFEKFYDGKFSLAETSYNLFRSSGGMNSIQSSRVHSYFFVLGSGFIEREKFIEFVRTIKLFQSSDYELDRSKTVNVFVGSDYKKSYLEGILSDNRLKEANQIIGDILK